MWAGKECGRRCALGFDHHAEAALDTLGADAGVSEALEAAQHQPQLLRPAIGLLSIEQPWLELAW